MDLFRILQKTSLCLSFLFIQNSHAQNVGIGTNTPMSKLHIDGNVRIGLINPTNTGAFPDYGDRLYFSGGPAGAVYNSENSDPLWIARYNQGQDNSHIRINLGDNIVHNDALQIGAYDLGNFVPQMHFAATGRVGIGTTSPLTKLHINSNSSNPIILQNNATSHTVGATQNYISFRDNANVLYGYMGDGSSSKQFNLVGHFKYAVVLASFGSNTGASHRAGVNINLNDKANIAFVLKGATEAIIDSVGRVGIGTIAPTSKLHVNGGIRSQNMGQITCRHYAGGTSISVPFTRAYVQNHPDETYIYSGVAPDLQDNTHCGSGTHGGHRFFDGSTSWKGQYILTLDNNSAGQPTIHGKWHGWNLSVTNAAGTAVVNGHGNISFTLWHNGTEWRVQHLVAQSNTTNCECR